MKKATVGLALTGSFCTIRAVLNELGRLSEHYRILPIVSAAVASTDTRFARADAVLSELSRVTGSPVISTLSEAEPIGPEKLLDLLIIAPCTGNTLAKIALGITDTPVALAYKAHTRNRRPTLIAPSTNDALGACAKNMGLLMNTKHLFFVPFSQDAPDTKESSLVAHFSLLREAADAALAGKQLQPMLRA